MQEPFGDRGGGQLKLTRAWARCVCCLGKWRTLVGVYAWFDISTICHRCNMSDCGHADSFGRTDKPETWACMSRIGERIQASGKAPRRRVTSQ